MSNRSGDRTRRLSRGDRRRNDKLARLRSVVTRESAVLAFDLAADKQVCALTDQDSQVLARRTVMVKAWQLAEAVEWGLARAAAAGFDSVVVACEPTGHRWRVLDQIVAERGSRLVCVQPLLVHRAREAEDFTRNKNDDSDAMIIARLVTELRCYLPERAAPAWARLRHLGARRAHLVTDVAAARQQVRDVLECVFPAALAAGKGPAGVQELDGRYHRGPGPGRRHRRPDGDPAVGVDPLRRRRPPRAGVADWRRPRHGPGRR